MDCIFNRFNDICNQSGTFGKCNGSCTGSPLEENELGPSLTARLDRAVEYLEENPTVNCVVTGGMGDKDTPSEAEVMYDYLRRKEFPLKELKKMPAHVIQKENLENAKQIIQSKGWNQNIAIITEYYHEFRAGRLADELGMRSYAVCAETPWYIFFFFLWKRGACTTKIFSVIFNVKNRFQSNLKSIFIFYSLNNIKEKRLSFASGGLSFNICLLNMQSNFSYTITTK